MKIRSGDPFEPQAKDLLTASHALMESLFPAESNHFLSLDKLKQPHISFFIAEQNQTALGCAALANMGDYGELKSMFVADAARKSGVGSALINHLENHARKTGLSLLRLETGDLLHAAHALYCKQGFEKCGAFGTYPKDGKHSVYMEKVLAP